MSGKLALHTEILPPAQEFVWPLMKEIPPEFILYGGTAAALYFGHRQSLDFDFFSNVYPIDKLERDTIAIPFINKHMDGYKMRDNGFQIDISLNIKELKTDSIFKRQVKITFLSNGQMLPGRLGEPYTVPENGIKLASPEDVFAHKIWASSHRTTDRDLIDIVQFIRQGYDLQTAFAGCLALAKKSKVAYAINLANLKNDYTSKQCAQFFRDPDDYRILKAAATAVDLDKVFKTKVTVQDSLYNTESTASLPLVRPAQKKTPAHLSRENFIRDHVWNDDRTLLNDIDSFLAFLLACWPMSYYEAIDDYGFTDADFARALGKASGGVFRYENEWIYWHEKLGISPVPPLPRRMPFGS